VCEVNERKEKENKRERIEQLGCTWRSREYSGKNRLREKLPDSINSPLSLSLPLSLSNFPEREKGIKADRREVKKSHE